jgi:hypothetical protein
VTTDHHARRDSFTDGVPCVRCQVMIERVDLDRILWCEDCVEFARRKALGLGRWVGGMVAALLAAYIWWVIDPSPQWMGVWVGLILASFYLAGRLAREVLYGIERIRGSKAAGGPPPADESQPDGSSESDDDGPPRVNFRR